MKLSDRAYNVLKYVCQIAIPAVLTCVATILTLLGIESDVVAAVVGIGSAINAMLGGMLGISTHQYNKEHIADEIEEERWGDDNEDC